MESRCSSCSFALDDGPDFLDFAVNQFSVDDDSEFLFSPWPEMEPSDSDGKVCNEAKNELQEIEMKTQSNYDNGVTHAEKNQLVNEGENSAIVNTSLAITESKERRRKSNTDGREIRKTSQPFKSDKRSFQIINAEKLTNRQAEKMGLKMTKSNEWKSQYSSVSRGMKLDPSLGPGKNSQSMKTEYWPLLRNLSYRKEKHSSQGSQKNMELYDIATNLYALKKEQTKAPILHLPKTKTKLKTKVSLRQPSGSLWLQNSLPYNNTKTPITAGSSRLRRYSEQWLPEKSVPSGFEDEVGRESGYFQSDTRRQLAKDASGIILKSVLHNLDALRLSDPSRNNLLKHSLSSLDRKNREVFRRKALPLVRGALAFQHNNKKLP